MLKHLYSLILALTDPSFIFQTSLGNHALKPDSKKMNLAGFNYQNPIEL